MGAIVQAGNVTPGHAVIWTADGIAQDGGPFPSGQRVIASLRGANFNTTNDQPIIIPQRFVAFQLTSIIVTNATVSLTTAAGGFYPAAAKGGTPIVSAAQTYSALTTANSLMTATLASFGANTRFSSANLATLNGLLALYLSLTTAQGVAATADCFVCGIDLS
jgi:hypothetical protein